jgi:hypothetical protein
MLALALIFVFTYIYFLNMRLTFLETELFTLWTQIQSIKSLVRSRGQSNKFFSLTDGERAEVFKNVLVTGPLFEDFYKACFSKDADVVSSSFQKCAENPEIYERIEAALNAPLNETTKE